MYAVCTSTQVLTLFEVLAGIMEGIAAPLKVRLMQVLVPQNPLVLNFRLLNLVAFYDVTLRNLQLGGSTISDVSGLSSCNQCPFFQGRRILA